MPTSYLWFFWRVSVINSNRHQWMLDSFLPNGYPTGFDSVRVRPRLNFFADDVAIQVSIRNEARQRKNETFPDSIVFDCFTYSEAEQGISDMILETSHWSERLNMVEQTIRHLLGESGSK